MKGKEDGIGRRCWRCLEAGCGCGFGLSRASGCSRRGCHSEDRPGDGSGGHGVHLHSYRPASRTHHPLHPFLLRTSLNTPKTTSTSFLFLPVACVSQAAQQPCSGRGLEEGPRGEGGGSVVITKLGREATEGSPECEECRGHCWAGAGSLPAEPGFRSRRRETRAGAHQPAPQRRGSGSGPPPSSPVT